MKDFRYTALDADGAPRLTGTICATDEAAARQTLRARGLRVIGLKETAGPLSHLFSPASARRLTLRARTRLAQSLENLLSCGHPPAEALKLLAADEEAAGLGPAAQTALGALEAGEPLHRALAPFFPGTEKALIEYGEKASNLRASFGALAAELEERRRRGKRISSALAYPTFVLCFGFGVLAFQVYYILPSYLDVYAQLSLTVPPIVGAVSLFVGATLRYGWLLAAAAVLVGAVLTRRSAQNPRIQAAFFRLPVLGAALRAGARRRFYHGLAALAAAGVPFVEALRMVVPEIRPAFLRPQLSGIADEVSRGTRIAQALGAAPLFGSLDREKIRVAEQTGELVPALKNLEIRNEELLNETLGALTGFLEPAVTLLVGAVVALVALTFLIPVYQLSTGF